jgi:hypothetical protein
VSVSLYAVEFPQAAAVSAVARAQRIALLFLYAGVGGIIVAAAVTCHARGSSNGRQYALD